MHLCKTNQAGAHSLLTAHSSRLKAPSLAGINFLQTLTFIAYPYIANSNRSSLIIIKHQKPENL
jgi:hypothetical protein